MLMQNLGAGEGGQTKSIMVFPKWAIEHSVLRMSHCH